MNPETMQAPSLLPCPGWAQDMIQQLLQLEVFLGNIPEVLKWKSESVEKLSESVFGDGTQIKEEHTEMVFAKICQGLKKDGFEAEQIAEIINCRIGYKGGPKYCNAKEVLSTLH